MKKLVSLVLVLAMIMSLSATVFAVGTTTLYCNAPSGWSKCNVYWWGGSDTPTWPGVAMTKNAEGLWYYAVPSDATNVIFNNGSSQTNDLKMPTGDKVQYNYTDKEWVTIGTDSEELTLIKVYVDAAATGLTGTPNAYVWDCVSANSWPGSAMTLVEGTIYSIEVYSDTKNIIFNDGSNQTGDLVVPAANSLWDGSKWTTYAPAPKPVTYNLVTGVMKSISIPVGTYANVVVDATAGNRVLTVNGNRNYYDWHVQVGVTSSTPLPSGVATSQLAGGSKYTIAIYNDSADTVQVLDVMVDVPPVGTKDSPDALKIGKNTASVKGGGEPYVYTWTASEDGELTITVDNACADWTYVIDVYGDVTKYGDTYFSDDTPVVRSQTVSVKAGDRVEVVVGTASFGAANVLLNASFKAGEVGGGSGDSTPGSSKENAIDITNNSFQSIEGGATVWFVYDDTADAANGIYSQLLNISSSAAYTAMYEGNKLTVDADGYVNCEIESANGKYYIVITNNSGDKEFFSITVEDKPQYVMSEDALYVGDNNITLDPSAKYTLWEFEPTETGTYVFFISNTNALIGNWGSSWYPQDMTENKSNTLEWTCTSVGQSILIGVAGVNSAVLNIKLKSAYTPEDLIDWTFYENKDLKDDYVVNGELVAIDVTDDLPDEVWIDEDGFVRYGSEFGPIVVVDLENCPVNFVEAAYNGQLRFYVYQDGKLVARIDVNDAITEYVEAGVTPLTEELIFMLKMLGQKNGWYDQSIPGFYLWEDDVVVNPEEAWLFPCYIVEGTELEEPEVVLSDYIVAGTSGLCGSEWDPADSANRMIDNGDGTYSITFKGVAVGSYEFKITKGSWAENWGIGGPNGSNVPVNVETISDVNITFNPTTGEIMVNNEEAAPATGDVNMTGLVFVVALASMSVVAIVSVKKKFF